MTPLSVVDSTWSFLIDGATVGITVSVVGVVVAGPRPDVGTRPEPPNRSVLVS